MNLVKFEPNRCVMVNNSFRSKFEKSGGVYVQDVQKLVEVELVCPSVLE